MEPYNYIHTIKSDIEDWLNENGERYANDDGTIDYDAVYDDMFIDDSITGNGSGSYTFNAYTAEENLCHNLGLLRDALDEFGGDYKRAMEDPEYADVTIRCYLLGQYLSECLDRYNDDHFKSDEEEDVEEQPNESYRRHFARNSMIAEAYQRQNRRMKCLRRIGRR